MFPSNQCSNKFIFLLEKHFKKNTLSLRQKRHNIQKKRNVKPACSFYKEKIAKRIRKGLVEIRSSGNPNQSLHTIPLGGIIQTIDEQYRGLMQRDAPKDYVILAKYLELLKIKNCTKSYE